MLPADLAHFNRRARARDGLDCRCRECKGYPFAPKRLELIPEGYKRCSRCHQCKPATPQHFSREARHSDGLRADCKRCEHERSRQYRKLNVEKLRERQRKYHSANAERLREYKRRYYNAHAEKKREWQRDYRLTHIAEVTARNRRWDAENPDRARARRRRYAVAHPEQAAARSRNRRARERGATGKHTIADVRAQLKRQKSKCYYCHAKLDSGYHVDHVVPLSRGGANDPANIVIACPSCNRRKNTKLPHEWEGSGGRMF